MEIKSGLIFKGIITVVLVFIIGKILSEIFRSLFNGMTDRMIYGKKPENEDIDVIINRKINELRQGQVGTIPVRINTTANNIPDKNSSENSSLNKLSTIQIYEQALENAKKKNDERKIKEYKLALELFDHLQWGEGKHYKIIESLALQNYELPITSQDIAQNFKEMDQKKIFHAFDTSSPLGHSALSSLLGHKSAFDHLIKMNIEGIPVDLSVFKMSTLPKRKVKGQAISLALYMLTKRNVFNSEIDFKAELDYFLGPALAVKKLPQEKKFPLNHFIQLIKLNDQGLKSTMEIQDSFVKLAHYIDPLLSLPELKKGDTEVARILLEVSENDNFETIKKSYKNLVSSKHPDKFQSLKLPTEIMNIVNNNFLKIQESFTMLKKELGEE